jgi:2,5-diketo-D-gluconate reductase A
VINVPALKLSDGNSLPHIGLGTWPMNDDEVARIIPQAVEMGYRLFDTAVNYGNEVGVGQGLRNSSVAREDLFVTTKVPGRHHGYDTTKQSLEESLRRLATDYVDLYLIHWPNPQEDKYVDTWRAFVDLQKEGKVRSIGVSNFKPAHLERLANEVGVLPVVNQVQLYPAVTRVEDRKFANEHETVVESWSPLGRGANEAYYGGSASFLEHPIFTQIAEAHGKTTGQIILRWHVQLGLVPLPKTSNAERLAQNIDVFSFSLTDDEMALISAIDDGRAKVADSDTHQES